MLRKDNDTKSLINISLIILKRKTLKILIITFNSASVSKKKRYIDLNHFLNFELKSKLLNYIF